MSTHGPIDPKSFLIGVLSTALLVFSMGAAYDVFNSDEVSRLKRLAAYITPEGDLDLGAHKIVMLGSRIYDDGSEGGGLILRGGANRVQFHGNTLFHEGWWFARETMDMPANLNMGNRRIIMLGSNIYDDGSEGGGLILRGGANRIHLHGSTQIYDGFDFRQPTLNLNANLNLGRNKIIMQGSSIYDDGSNGGGLILQGGANNIHFFGRTLQH